MRHASHRPPEPATLHAAALAIADACREHVLAAAPGRRRERKPDASFVTDLDLALEALVRERLGREFPDHAVLGEEMPPERAGAEIEWVVDPVDGTHSLVHGVPLWGTLLGVRWRGEPVVGVIDLPRLGVRYHGGRGLGAFRNGEPLRVEDVAPAAVGDEILLLGERRQFASAGLLPLFDRLVAEHPHARIYPDCFGHGLVLEGAAGAMVDPDLNPWDVTATLAIAGETGARIERLPTAPGREGRFNLLVGRPTVVDWVLARTGE